MQGAWIREDGVCAYRIPESASALWRIVSLTAANTRRMFEVSVACVRLAQRRDVSHGLSDRFESVRKKNQDDSINPWVATITWTLCSNADLPSFEEHFSILIVLC